MRLSRGELDRLKVVARRLEPLPSRVVFLGGAVAGLLVTDSAGSAVRPTKDVDVVVEVATYLNYTKIEGRLRDLGFIHDQEEKAPICRWLVEGIKVDVMPPDPSVIGFSNRWYLEAISASVLFTLEPGLDIHLITAPYFIATKLVAFAARGQGDYLRSPDIEDVVIVLDGRPELPGEIERSPADLKQFLSVECRALLGKGAFREALPGHLDPDEASQGRAALVLAKMERIAGYSTMQDVLGASLEPGTGA